MDRILPWLAILLAATIAVIAVVELDNRSDEDEQIAVPTFLQPSPLEPTTAPSTPDDVTATASPRATRQRTPSPPRTPTPAPALTPGRPDRSRGPTPRTGGNSLAPGLALAAIALVVRTRLGRRAGSYCDGAARPLQRRSRRP